MCAGVQLNGRQIKFKQPHVLHDQGVCTGFPALPDKAARSFQFIVTQNGIECNQHAGIEAVRMSGQAFDIRQGIAGIGTAANIYGIRTVLDGGHAEIGISGGREQFYFPRLGTFYSRNDFTRHFMHACPGLLRRFVAGSMVGKAH